MFHHKTALNMAILEGVTKVFNNYGGSVMADFLDITWFEDTDWVWTFEQILKGIKEGKTEKVWGIRSEYQISANKQYIAIKKDDTIFAQIPTYSENDFFLFLTTLLRGNYEY